MKQVETLIFITFFSACSLNAQITMQKGKGGIRIKENGENILFYQSEPKNQRNYLDRLIKVLPPDRRQPASGQLSGTPPAHISPEDFTWSDWLSRTGEFPPNFDELPDLPFLPDPLTLDEGGENIPVTMLFQWNKKREQIKKDVQYWITGIVPPPPDNLTVEIVREETIGLLRERDVIIRFGPDNKAQLHLILLIHSDDGLHSVFIGNENKLPVDQNSLMALIAPRGLMLTSSITETADSHWGMEQAYLSAKKAYDFLGASDKIAIDLRDGLHAPAARDMENYLDFFDYVFGRGNIQPKYRLYVDYSFIKWLELSREMINPLNYPNREIGGLLKNSTGKIINRRKDWELKTEEIKKNIKWGLGDEPPSMRPGIQPDYKREVVGMPRVRHGISSTPLMFGQLYYPSEIDTNKDRQRLPVVIWLHEYVYSMGYAKSGDMISRLVEEGFAVYAFDQIGFGTRIEEGRFFYERFPNWSKMGRMVADVRYSVDALSEIEFIDPLKIYTAAMHWEVLWDFIVPLSTNVSPERFLFADSLPCVTYMNTRICTDLYHD